MIMTFRDMSEEFMKPYVQIFQISIPGIIIY